MAGQLLTDGRLIHRSQTAIVGLLSWLPGPNQQTSDARRVPAAAMFISFIIVMCEDRGYCPHITTHAQHLSCQRIANQLIVARLPFVQHRPIETKRPSIIPSRVITPGSILNLFAAARL